MLKKGIMISRHKYYLFVMKISDVLIHELLFVISARRNVEKWLTGCYILFS